MHPLIAAILAAHHKAAAQAAQAPGFISNGHLNMTGTQGTWVIFIAILAAAALAVRAAFKHA
jgi:hypothetical protein